jgi:zinc protease
MENGFTESEVDRVRKEYLAMLDNQVRQAATRDSTDIARTILAQIGDDRVFRSPEQNRDLLAPALKEVSARDLHQALLRVWSPGHRLVQVTGNADLAGDPAVSPESRMLAVVEDSRKSLAVRPSEERAVNFPYVPAPVDTGIIALHDEIPGLGIRRIWFENQVRLHLKPTDFRKNQVLVEVAFGPGSVGEPEGKPGISRLAEDIVNESGVGGLTRDELDRSLAGTSTRIGFSITPDRFSFLGESTPSELELLFQLIHARIADPAFREDARTFALERYSQQYRQYTRSVDGTARIHLPRFLAGGDPRFGMPTDTEIASLTLEDVTGWLLLHWKKAPLEISLVGDFDIDAVLRLASRYVGTLSPRQAVEAGSPRKGPRFPAGETRTIPVETAIDKTLVVTAYATDDFWNIHRTRRLSILGDVFSERLREQVREKLGAAYSPVAFHHPSRAFSGYGVFQAMVHVNPADAERIVEEIRAIAARLTASPVPRDELKRMVDPALTRIRDLVRTNEYWLNSVLSGSGRHPEQLEWSRTILSDYASISPADLHRLARTYLQPGKEAVMVVHPQ